MERYQSGGSAFQLRFFSDSLPPLSVFASSAVQSFGFRQRLLPERELCLSVLGLSFYPLEQAPNMVIYAMSKLGQQRAVQSKSRGFLAPSPGTNVRRCCQKIHLLTSAANSVPSLSLELFSHLLRVLYCMTKPSFSGVVCPVDKLHRSQISRD